MSAVEARFRELRPDAVRVLPFEAMTPEQQAEHLVHAHGYDDSYFYRNDSPAHASLGTDAAVVRAWLHGVPEELLNTENGDPLPFPSNRVVDHDDDHDQYPDEGGGGFPHVHTKPTP